MQHEPKALLRVVVRCVIHPENSAAHKKWGSFKMVTHIKTFTLFLYFFLSIVQQRQFEMFMMEMFILVLCCSHL